MCGIVAILGNPDIVEPIIQGLTLLKSRGYDSCGVCYNQDGELKTVKYASTSTHNSLSILEAALLECSPKSSIAIAHTRWATHGTVCDANAHPHSDNKNRIAVVHNGIIECSNALKAELVALGYTFLSHTDTEVVSVLAGYYLDQGDTMEVAIQRTVERLTGTWSLVFMHKDAPNKIWLTRNGSPLLLGLEEDYIMIASEQIAFGNYVKKYIVLNNHDLIEVCKERDNTITYSKNIHRYVLKTKPHMDIELVPSAYGCIHWMKKEILEQPESITRAISNGGRIENNSRVKLGGLDANSERLMELNHVVILGCGTSLHAGMWSLDLFKTLDIFDTASIFDGGEFQIKDIPKRGKTGVILVSQSGETKDLHRCIQMSKDFGLITIGVVNAVDSMIARETDCGVYLNAGREVAVASTKSFTNQCAILAMIAVWFSQNKRTCLEKRINIIEDILNLPFQMQQVIDKYGRDSPDMQRIMRAIMRKNSMFLLGRGSAHAIALEGALKMKEIVYIHAEGYSASSLKHGPLALIEKDMPVVLLDISREYREKNYSCFQEVIARNAFVVRITDDVSASAEARETSITLAIDENRTFCGLLANCVIQLLSYFVSAENGNNPDYPRNLAKVVTVE
jgi:glucosamine--fructose-6-phosphate aminotransferase (isomerizing)